MPGKSSIGIEKSSIGRGRIERVNPRTIAQRKMISVRNRLAQIEKARKSLGLARNLVNVNLAYTKRTSYLKQKYTDEDENGVMSDTYNEQNIYKKYY